MCSETRITPGQRAKPTQAGLSPLPPGQPTCIALSQQAQGPSASVLCALIVRFQPRVHVRCTTLPHTDLNRHQ